MNVLFAVLCVALAYSAFCRAVHLNRSALLRIRWAVTLIGGIAMYGLYRTITGWMPDGMHVLLVGAFWLYMTAFAKAWPAGTVPPQMQRPSQRKPMIPDHVL